MADMKVSPAHREQAKAESDSAFEKLRADVERSVNSITTSITTRLMVGLAISVAFLSLVVAFTGVFLRS